MFNHVLLPTDGSKGCLKAAAIVADLAKNNPNSVVTVLCAIAIIDPTKTDLDELVVEQKNHAVRRHAEDAVATTCAIFEQLNIKCERKIVTGDPVSAAIVEYTQKDAFDVIAMASRGLTHDRNDRHYLGSVTEHVVRRVGIPALIIPIHEDRK